MNRKIMFSVLFLMALMTTFATVNAVSYSYGTEIKVESGVYYARAVTDDLSMFKGRWWVCNGTWDASTAEQIPAPPNFVSLTEESGNMVSPWVEFDPDFALRFKFQGDILSHWSTIITVPWSVILGMTVATGIIAYKKKKK